MTNAQIVFAESQQLAEQGIIQYTGRTFEIKLESGEIEVIKETEPIHTYQKWKELGYQVRKGEKAIAKFPIWKYAAGKKKENENGEEEETASRMFRKVAAWFTFSQVDKIEKH